VAGDLSQEGVLRRPERLGPPAHQLIPGEELVDRSRRLHHLGEVDSKAGRCGPVRAERDGGTQGQGGHSDSYWVGGCASDRGRPQRPTRVKSPRISTSRRRRCSSTERTRSRSAPSSGTVASSARDKTSPATSYS